MSDAINASATPENRIKGVFSAQKVMKVGTGATTRKTVQQTYYYVEELESGDIDVQPLNKNYVPSGVSEVITKEELLAQYSPEPEFYQQTVFPKMQEMNKTLARADRHRQRGETFTAELEYGEALKVDEENVRANFGIGLCYMQRGESAKAEDILQRLVKLDAAFETKHKHLFNEFGINLRKTKMYKQAVGYYERATELSDKDENLQYNMGRALFEMGDFSKAKECFERSLEINPELVEAHKMLAYMENKGLA